MFVYLKNIHCRVWLAAEREYSSIGTITNIDCAVSCRLVVFEWFGSFERMDMVLKHSHDFIIVEERYPMEEGIQKSLWISIESLAYTVDGDVVVDKFNTIFTRLKDITDKLLLDTIETVQIA